MQPNNTTPFFSQFLAMKRSNPSAYWTKAVQAQMVSAYKQHGIAFYDHYEQAKP